MSSAASPTPAAPDSCTRPSYFQGLPDVFADGADLELHINGTVLKAHSILLSMHSSVFGNIVTDLRKDHDAFGQHALVVPMVDDDYDSVLSLLEFIYKSSSAIGTSLGKSSKPDDSLWRLAAPAHKYGFETLLAHCDARWSTYISAGTAKPTSGPQGPFSIGCLTLKSMDSSRTLAALELLLIKYGTPPGT